MATLAEIRAKLQEQEVKRSPNSSGGDNAIYPFWNIPEGTTATLRFLSDKDPNNTFFWVERQMIRLPFAGIKGQSEAKPTTVQVPCMEMWGEPCPVLSEIRPWFKDPSLEDMGRKYWKKRSYIFQGFVVNSPLEEDSTPENPIRRFVINPSIFNIIRSALMNPDMEDLPTDIDKGRDFKLTKTQKGGYADYSTSTWSFKERSVQVPCMEMWGEPCPVLSEIRPWFKDPSLEDMGRKYWKKRSYIFQGFVVNSPLEEDSTPENPIRRFVINPSIFNIIRSALMNPDMEDLPTDIDKGRDFKLTKTQKGGYADYSTSTWSFKERSVSDSERSAIDSHGLHNLGDYLPKKPSAEEVKIIAEMFKASVDGELYDESRFGQYYRPAGMASSPSSNASATTTATTTATATPTPAPQAEVKVETPVVEAKVEAPAAQPEVATATATASATDDKSKASADDILAMIRARQSK